MNFQEALRKVRNTRCIPQRGDTCHGYGGIGCTSECPMFSNGLKRRRESHEEFTLRKIRECQLPSGATIRISRDPTKETGIVIETGEYVNDGNIPPVFTLFERKILSEEVFEMILFFFANPFSEIHLNE